LWKAIARAVFIRLAMSDGFQTSTQLGKQSAQTNFLLQLKPAYSFGHHFLEVLNLDAIDTSFEKKS